MGLVAHQRGTGALPESAARSRSGVQAVTKATGTSVCSGRPAPSSRQERRWQTARKTRVLPAGGFNHSAPGGGVLPARLQAWGGSPGDSVSLGSAASGTMHTPARAAGSRRHRRAERQDPANVQKANALAGCHGNAACGAGSAQALGSALKAASAFGSAPVFWLGDP